METKAKPKKVYKASTDPVRVEREFRKFLTVLLQNARKRPLGKKVNMTGILKKAVSKLQEEDWVSIESETLTNQDRFELRYAEHCKQNGKIDRDKFFGMVLSGALSI